MKAFGLTVVLLAMLVVSGAAAQADTAGETPAPEPDIAVVKSVSNDGGETWTDAQLAPGLAVQAGDPLHYLIQVVNIGDFPLTNITITDTKLDASGCVVPPTLEKAGLIECMLGPTPAPAGQSVNTVLVTAQYNGETLTATDSAYAYAGDIAALEIEKMAGIGGAWHSADSAPGFGVPHSGRIRFRIIVTNTGTETFTNITVTDSMFDLSDCDIPDELPPGLSFECRTPRIEVESGSHVNVATVTAVADGQTYTASDEAHFTSVDNESGTIIIIEGPVEAINGNIIIIFGEEIVLDPNDPLLVVIRIGDIVRIEGIEDSTTTIIIAVVVVIVDIDIYVGEDPDDVYRDDADCGNPPPPWAPAHGWRRKCQAGNVTQGALPPGLRNKNKNKKNK